jgi:magnesium-transporting ATPase (P-type)
VCESLQGSGNLSLIVYGLLQAIYGLQNLSNSKNRVITNTIKYMAYLMRQIGSILIGILAPIFFKYNSPLSNQKLWLFTCLSILTQMVLSLGF